jgi:N-acetylglutamate synthase/N-acetylornithine aminotransferase
VKTVACDFKGNVLESSRTFTHVYATDPNWSVVAASVDAAAAETDDNALLIDSDSTTVTTSYASTTKFDALNRPTEHVTWDGSKAKPATTKRGSSRASMCTCAVTRPRRTSSPRSTTT